MLGYPGISLLRVAVEETQVHALFIQNATLFPQLKQARLLIGQSHQLLTNKHAAWIRKDNGEVEANNYVSLIGRDTHQRWKNMLWYTRVTVLYSVIHTLSLTSSTA